MKKEIFILLLIAASLDNAAKAEDATLFRKEKLA